MPDLDAVREHAETLTPGSPLRIAMDNAIARIDALTAALREARVIVDEVALFVSERGTHRVGGIAAQVRDRIDAALAGKE